MGKSSKSGVECSGAAIMNDCDDVYPINRVCIQEDDPNMCNELADNNGRPTSTDTNSCFYCANFTENAERAWSVMSSFVQQLSQMQTLENENQQLSRINEEQQIYMANQRQRYQNVEDELTRSGAKIRDLEERVHCIKAQYREVLNKATEAQEAANMWRQKYDVSQELVLELERKSSENHKLHISSLAVAASFSKSHDVIEAKNMSLEAKVAELQRQNEELHRKVTDLECRTRLLEKKSNRRELRKEKRLETELPPPEPTVQNQTIEVLSTPSISEIFQCSFFREMEVQTLMEPCEFKFGAMPEEPKIQDMSSASLEQYGFEVEDDDSEHLLQIDEDENSSIH